MRFEFFIWEDFKNEEERLRQKIAKSLRSKPQSFKDYIMSNLLRRIEESFDSLEYRGQENVSKGDEDIATKRKETGIEKDK